MSLNFLRNPNIVNNIFGDTMRKRMGLSFRKTLGVYNYKIKPAEYYGNPHQVPLRLKERLMNRKNENATRTLNAIKRNSIRPFGRFTTKGQFVKDLKRVPIFNIPDVNNFKLLPYVEWRTDRPKFKNIIKYTTMDRKLLEEIRIEMMNSTDENVKLLAQEIFETEEGKEIVEEYFSRINKRTKLKVVNF